MAEITEEDVLRIVRENLEIDVESTPAGGYTTVRHHEVKLLLAGKVIASAYLPDTNDDT